MSSVIEHDVFLVPSQFASIQEAIDATVRPATIVVSPGVYAEDLVVAQKESLVIESARFGRRGVVLAGRSAGTVLRIEGSSVYLSGIEIRSDQRARGVSAVDSGISLQECVIAGNRVDAEEAKGAGMECVRSRVRVQKSTIAGNVVRSRGGNANGAGLYLAGCKVEIAGSSIQTNAAYAARTARGSGIWCEQVQMRMWRSRVTDNAAFGAASVGAGIYFAQPSGAQIGGSVITGNGAANGRGGGIFIDGDPTRVAIHPNTVLRQNHPDDFAAGRPAPPEG